MISLIGWILIAGVVAWAFLAARREGRLPASPLAEGGAEGAERGPAPLPPSGAWCDAMEKLLGASALLFDEGLKLVAAGEGGRKFAPAAAEGFHLVDVVPTPGVGECLRRAADARRGECPSWTFGFQGKKFSVSAIGVGAWVMILYREGEDETSEAMAVDGRGAGGGDGDGSRRPFLEARVGKNLG